MSIVYLLGYLLATAIVLWSLGALASRRANMRSDVKFPEAREKNESNMRSAA